MAILAFALISVCELWHSEGSQRTFLNFSPSLSCSPSAIEIPVLLLGFGLRLLPCQPANWLAG